MTEQLYNKGSETHGRPATIGSLLAMLKEDNPEQFYAIIKCNDSTNGGLTQEELKEMIEKHNEAERIEADETQEDKLARWLSKPEFYFHRKVSDPRKALDAQDDKKIYNARYMKPYNSTAKTMIIKGEKGQGKTYALEEYVKKHNPEYCLFVSFRRSLSSEIIKRLEKHGFVNYLDIKGQIDNKHKRVIIQVESLHRMRWTKECDFFICDEIESTRGQFFSETCRLRNLCIEKYEMFLESSKQAVFMDADISENTVKHIKQTRGGKIHYIENTYKKIQSEFKEFYTTKPDKIFSKLCDALDKGEKLIIASNRSVEFMEAVRKQIHDKYPELKVQLFNSQTIRNEAVAKELANTDTWKKYDVVMYSPTISAGVSVEYEHFNKCFCYFTNNGKVNSMRQMINRVRKFSTNEFYYCLQSFGGNSKPQTVDEMEKHIVSNRFIDKPEFIFSKEKYDGTRTYPYRNAGFWLWLYNDTEINRDKNMFIYKFLREQYHAGIGNMDWMGETMTEHKITEADVKETTADLKYKKIEAIATAEPITDEHKEDIIKRLSEEKPVSEGEVFSLKRNNLLNHYDLGERTINPLFVETYGSKSVRKAYTNRGKLEKGLNAVCESESRQFNGLLMDMTNIQEDLKRDYVALKLVIATELIKICGFDGVYDTNTRTKDEIEKGFKKKKKTLKAKMVGICDVLGRTARRRPDVDKWNLRGMLDFVNSALDVLQLNIKETKRRSGIYSIEGIEFYNFEKQQLVFVPYTRSSFTNITVNTLPAIEPDEPDEEPEEPLTDGIPSLRLIKDEKGKYSLQHLN